MELLLAKAMNYFILHSSSGIITISHYARLDRDVTDNYVIVVNAIDGGVPSETSTATVKVRITDINNKAPRFGFDFWEFIKFRHKVV